MTNGKTQIRSGYTVVRDLLRVSTTQANVSQRLTHVSMKNVLLDACYVLHKAATNKIE